jgi:hypothetical protein
LSRSKRGVGTEEHNFDAERNLWFCDLQIRPGDAYTPFARLSLVRYQPYSVDGPSQGNSRTPSFGAHLSQAVISDFIQLLPNRVATVTLKVEDPQHLRIKLSGSGFRATNRLRASIQRHHAHLLGEIGWIGIPAPDVTLKFRPQRQCWEPDSPVELPLEVGRLRVLLQEYEVHVSDNADEAERLVYAGIIEL